MRAKEENPFSEAVYYLLESLSQREGVGDHRLGTKQRDPKGLSSPPPPSPPSQAWP